MQITSVVVSSLLAGLALAAPVPADSANAASNHMVASLGSSYSAGVGLDESYGKILANLLAKKADLPTPYNNYHNYAVSGTNVSSVPEAAKKLGKQKYTAVVMTAGGNDLNYVGCLKNDQPGYCTKTISKEEYIKRYTNALDSIAQNVADAKTPIYVVTYPQALGKDTVCAASNDPKSECNLGPAQVNVAKDIYAKVISWTVAAFNDWKKAHPQNRIKMITMLTYSHLNHAVGSKKPWINGSKMPAKGDGATWHPNKAGAEFIAQAIYNDLNGLPAPEH